MCVFLAFCHIINIILVSPHIRSVDGVHSHTLVPRVLQTKELRVLQGQRPGHCRRVHHVPHSDHTAHLVGILQAHARSGLDRASLCSQMHIGDHKYAHIKSATTPATQFLQFLYFLFLILFFFFNRPRFPTRHHESLLVLANHSRCAQALRRPRQAWKQVAMSCVTLYTI